MSNNQKAFYIVCLSQLTHSIAVSVYTTILNPDKKSKGDDYDFSKNSLSNRAIWYLSQNTYQTQLLLTTYFIQRLLGYESPLFEVVASSCLVVNIQYYILLAPKRKFEDLIDHHSVTPHFMDTYMILCELYLIKKFDSFVSPLPYYAFAISYGYFAHYMRGVWPYNLLKYDEWSGWKLMLQSIGMSLTLQVAMMGIHNALH